MGIIFKGYRIAGTGKPGESAYEAAQRGGFEGTESEFSEGLSYAAEINIPLDCWQSSYFLVEYKN